MGYLNNNTRMIGEAFGCIIARTEGLEERPGTLDTPERAAKAWVEKTSGYRDDPAQYFKTFEPEHTGIRGMVVVRDIELESMCEHHLERVWGFAHVGYIPNKRVLGLSKFYRAINALSRRLSVQERLTASIADAIMEHLAPKGVGVVLECRHACMETRGIQKRGQTTLTSELRGVFYDDATCRAEFLALAKTSQPF